MRTACQLTKTGHLLFAIFLAAMLCSCNRGVSLPPDWPLPDIKPPPGSVAIKLPPNAVPESVTEYGHYYVQDYPADGAVRPYREWIVGFRTRDSYETLKAYYEDLLLPYKFSQDDIGKAPSISYLSQDESIWIALIYNDSLNMHMLMITKYEEDPAPGS